MEAPQSDRNLELVLSDHVLGPAAKIAYLRLWWFAGGKPGEIIITADWLGGACGRSARSAWEWLEELKEHDLLALGHRNPRRGTVEVTVYQPCPGPGAAITPDPQQRLPLSAGVSTQKPPRPLNQRNERDLSLQGLNVSKNSSSFKVSKDPERLDPEAAIAATIAAALAVDPAERKTALKRRLLAACGGGLAEWVAGAAANLVVYHGVPVADLNHILAELDNPAIRDRGAVFHANARRLAARKGVPWPRQKPGF